MPSFDIVSEVAMNEVQNAVENANREIQTRFDFRGVDASFELNKEEIKMGADADFQLKQMIEILRDKIVKRGMDTSCLDVGDVDHFLDHHPGRHNLDSRDTAQRTGGNSGNQTRKHHYFC